jgi:hypothetical protein
MLIPVPIGTFGGESVKALCSMETVNERLVYKIRRVSGIKNREVRKEISDGLKNILFFTKDAVRTEIRCRIESLTNSPSLIRRLGHIFSRV